jgi:MSHA biogenesis protein MshJ
MKIISPKYEQMLDNFPFQIRLVIIICIFVIIFLLWHSIVWNSGIANSNKLNTAIKNSENEVQLLETKLAALKNAKITGNLPQNNLNNTKDLLTTKLISNSNVTKILQDMLNSRDSINLLEFKQLPPKRFTKQNISTLQLFEHSIIMKFSSDFYSTVKYLDDVAKLKWALFWDSLEYHVIEYPKAEVTLQIHTLSSEN